jgi:hypothetical protein
VKKVGPVQYKFIRTDGALAPVQAIVFPKPTRKLVRADWTIGKNYAGWMAIEVMYPEHVVSNKAHFQIRCSTSAKLPDLAVDDIFLTRDNRVAVMVKNIGPGQVPDEVWTIHTPDSSGVYLYIDGRR